jgi:RHS repeat-associated protein
VDPNTGPSQTSYDAFDLPISATRSNGDVSQFKYDTLGRLVERLDADGKQIIEYGTTGVANGQITRATTRDVLGATTSQIHYDYWPAGMGGPSGKPRTVTRTMGGKTFATRFDYDQWGRLMKVNYPGINGVGFAVSNTYDPHGHLIEVKDTASATTYWKLRSADEGYRIGHEEYGNNTETRWSYQPKSGRVSNVVTSSQVNGTTVYKQKLALAYDARGEVLSRTDDIDNTRSRRYEHDLLGRLTRVLRQHGTGASTELDSITYNGIGNITARSSVGIYAYNAGTPNAVSAAGASTYAYDVLGNQVTRIGPAVSGGRQQITYSAFGMPTRITTGVAPQQSVQSITYDANHQRAYTSSSAGEKIWHVAELYELRETPGVGLEHSYRVYGPGRVVAEIATRQAGPGTPIQSTTTRYVHPDVSGSPDLITDQTGAVIARPLFDPFGKSVGSPPNVVTGFTGHRQTELGLIDMRGRYYDPTLGRFLTPDPVTGDSSASQALNRYSYVLNRPLALTDPTGWNPELCISNGGSGQCGDTQLEPDDLRLEEVVPEADPSPQGRADPEAAGVTTTNFTSGVAGAQPWQLWVGNQLHRRIQAMYSREHAGDVIYTDRSIARIVRENVAGRSHLRATTSELRKRPDIYNATLNHLYEIKSAAQLPMAGPTALLYAAIMTKFGLVPQLGPSSDPGTQGGLVLNGRAFAFWSPHDGVIIYVDVTPPRPPAPVFFRYTTRAELAALRSYINGTFEPGGYEPIVADSPAPARSGKRWLGIFPAIGYVGFKILKTGVLTALLGPPGTAIGLSPVGG